MGEAVAALRGELRELVREHMPAGLPRARSPTTRPTWRSPSSSAGCSPSGACSAWPGPRSSAAAARRRGSRPWCARRCGRTTSPAAPSTWASTGSARRSCGTARRSSSAQHLPPIARGEVIWCQGFSEPDAGSDLASLRTAARRDGDGWRVSGQKIWTSYATMAQWCFLLARTSRGEKKQQGLTVFLVPMSAPGIEVRPIRAMLGPHHLNEVFFDDVRVTEADVLGTVDEGWKVVQEVLAFERVGHRPLRPLRAAAPGRARRCSVTQWDELPAELRGRWARMLVHCRRARLLAYRVVALQSEGRVQPGDAAAYRIAVTRLDQDSAEVLMEIVALAAADRRRRPLVRPGGGGPLALLAGLHRRVGQHRDAADPAGPPAAAEAARGEHRAERRRRPSTGGRRAGRSRRPAGTGWSSWPSRSPAGRGGPRGARSSASWARGTSTPAATRPSSRRRPRCAAAPATGPSPTRWPSGCAVPADLDVDGLVVVADAVSGRRGGRAEPALGRGDPGRPPQPGDRPPGGRAAARSRLRHPPRPAAPRTTATARGTWRSGWCCRAGRCSACSTGPWT